MTSVLYNGITVSENCGLHSTLHYINVFLVGTSERCLFIWLMVEMMPGAKNQSISPTIASDTQSSNQLRMGNNIILFYWA